MNSSSLQGQRILVVGGSSGIGLATARLLSERGAELIIASRSADRLRRAAASFPHPPLTASVDIQDERSIEAFITEMDALHHLVLTASSAAVGNFLEVSVSTARRVFDSKFWGPYRLVKALHPKLLEGGSVTLFSGAAAERASPGFAFGSALNAAVEALAASLAVELAPIRVNTISPGVVDTPVWDDLLSEQARAALFADLRRRLPAGRLGRPEELARAVELVVTNEYMTGTVVRVDGGLVHV